MRALLLLLTALLVCVAAVPAPAQSWLAVTVVDDSTGATIPGAAVSIANGDARAVADADGLARLGLAPDIYVVQVTADGYDPVTFTTTLGPDGLEGEVGLVPAAVVLGDVVTTAERPRRDLARVGFYERREQGRGEFIDSDELDLRRPPSLAAALVARSGVRVQGYGDGVFRLVSSRQGLGPNGLRSNEPCPIAVFKDGARIDASDVARVSVEDLAGIEIYGGPATVPTEYRQFNPCGVVLMWSRME